MQVAEIVQLIASTGFSIVIAVWSLWFTFNNIDMAELITLLKYELKKED